MAEQRSEAWVKSASPAQVHAAHVAGELADYMSSNIAPAASKPSAAEQLLLDWVRAASPEDVVLAHAAGKLDSLLGRVPTLAFPTTGALNA
jgi:hypothetical protein